MGIASNNALFNVGHDEGVHKVPNTLGLLVAISSWTAFERKASVTMYSDNSSFPCGGATRSISSPFFHLLQTSFGFSHSYSFPLSVVLHVLLGPDQGLVESWVCVYLQLLSADAIFTNVAARAPCYCTVLKCKAERLCWLPGPPVASFQLAAKCMAALCIILLTEVHRKVLWGDRIRLNEVTKKCQETKSYKGADLHYLTLSIHIALP